MSAEVQTELWPWHLFWGQTEVVCCS